MTTDTRDIRPVSAILPDARHDILMALQTRFLSNTEIAAGYLNVIREMLRCERKRMKESIQSFRIVFGNQSRRCMTVVADRHFPVAPLHPALILRLHDVAVRARSRIVRHIRRPARVPEGVQAD